MIPNFNNYKKALAKMNISSSAALCNYLLEEVGIALLPGSDFGRSDEELTTRLSYVDFDGSQLLEEMKKNNTFSLEEQCPNIVQAMEALNKWILKLSY